ncbi:MAG: T9SS type A sorting domain-containing protein [Chitinophagales bacterium]|nr:T9SS type A sorting domain-containing protein [Chitinophagales bacterium]
MKTQYIIILLVSLFFSLTANAQNVNSVPMSYCVKMPDYKHWQSHNQNLYASYEQYWQLATNTPLAFMVTNVHNNPIAKAIIQLIDKDDELIWQAFTNKKGEAALWVPKEIEVKHALITYQGETQKVKELISTERGINEVSLNVDCQEITGADVVLLIDATSSMKDEFDAIFAVALQMDATIMLARDQGERYLVQEVNPENTSMAFTWQAAGGGADTESVDAILMAALKAHEWNTNKVASILYYITDAHPKQTDGASTQLSDVIKYAAEKGVAIVPIAASGLNEEGEYLLQNIAYMTGGTYAWLEDIPENSELHRVPALQNAGQSTELDKYLSVTIRDHSAYNSCTPDQGGGRLDVKPQHLATFTCFPNPSSTQTTLKLPGIQCTLEAYDLSGQLIKQWKTMDEKFYKLDVQDWPPGTYIIKCQTAKEQYRSRLIVVSE